jgi:hypothetical protein
MEERKRIELESKPSDVQVHEPSEPLDLPVDSVKPKGAAPAGAPPAPAPAAPRRQRSDAAPAVPQSGGEGTPNVPLVINPVARSVRVDRVE